MYSTTLSAFEKAKSEKKSILECLLLTTRQTSVEVGHIWVKGYAMGHMQSHSRLCDMYTVTSDFNPHPPLVSVNNRPATTIIGNNGVW